MVITTTAQEVIPTIRDENKISSLNFVNEKLKHFVYEANYNTEAVEKMAPESQERFESFKLENMAFKLHTRNELSFDEIKEKVKSGNVPVFNLLHGWTGTNAIFDSVPKPPDGSTIVEQILAYYPDAIIISPDGDGFGKSKFKDMPQKALVNYCGPEEYAEQVDFILKDIFELSYDNRKHIYSEAHSLGGATIQLMCGLGYLEPENCVSVCSALIPKEVDEFKFAQAEQLAEIQRQYIFLSMINSLAEKVKGMGLENLSNTVIDKVANMFLLAKMVGQEYSGNLTEKEFNAALAVLFEIHLPEIKKSKLTSAAMAALAEGVNIYSKKYDLDKMALVEEITGEKDELATSISTSQYITRAAVSRNYKGAGNDSVLTILPNAGHYAVLYGRGPEDPNDPTFKLIHRAYARFSTNVSIKTLADHEN